MDEQNSEAKAEINEVEPFLNSGDCWDEVTFSFDGNKELYVSQNFLSMASPVFKAMFENDFEEKKTGKVKLVDKTFDDMLEFLKCLHPNLQLPFTSENVLNISHIAEEYQCTLIINRCKFVMLKCLKNEIQYGVESRSDTDRYDRAQSCLKLLIKADSLHYQDQLSEAINTIARFNYKYFTGRIATNQTIQANQPVFCGSLFGSGTQHVPEVSNQRDIKDAARECKELFESLGEELQKKLLMQRLTMCDKTNVTFSN